MYKFAQMKNEDKEFLFNNVSIKMGINKAIIEKDFWVCLTLDYLFNKSQYKDCLTFKGGTSLSKGFNIINRFSEDIDLILDWKVLGVRENEPLEERSKTKQDVYNLFLNDEAAQFIRDKLLIDIKNCLGSILGFDLDLRIDEQEKQVINFYYPKLYKMDYVKQYVRLEIGPLAALTPSQNVKITPYVSENFPDLFTQQFTNVLTVSPERTFWEKATILHREANRAPEKPLPQKYSRHYYDIFKFTKTIFLQKAIEDKQLLEKVIMFKNKFYRDNWAKFEECLNGKFKLIPADYRIVELKKDYESMKEMLFGEIPTFDEIIEALKELEKIINS